MANDYEGFKKNVYALTSIDLNSYKERQATMSMLQQSRRTRYCLKNL